jgi:hypothetical protein
LAVRNGDFSGLPTIYDPLAVTTDSQGRLVRSPFPNNRINPIRFDPVAVNAMKYFPAPNAGAANALTNNFVAVGSTTNNAYQGDSRVDHKFNENWRMFFRLSHSWSNSTPLFDYGDGNVASTGGSGFVQGGAWSASMDHTFTISPTLLANIRYGFARSYVSDIPLGAGFLPSSLGLPTSLDTVAGQRVLEFPRFAFSDGAALGNNGYVSLIENPMAHSLTGSITKITGSHTIKMGGEWRRLLLNFSQYGFPAGQFTFDQTWTQQILNSANGTGSPYASFLLGLPNGGQVTHEPTTSQASVYMAAYVQDDWKVTPKLTLNLGLRWDAELPRTERYNRLSYWSPDVPSPLQGQVPASACLYCGDLRGQMFFVGGPGSMYRRRQGPTQWKDFGPRFGMAYSPTDKMVVRAGFGIAYLPSALQAAGTTGAPGVQGFGSTTQVQSSFDNQRTVYAYLRNPFPAGYNLPLGAQGGPLTNIGLGIGESFFDSYRNPYSIQWNVNVQHKLPGDMTAEVGYLANRGLFLVDGELTQPYSQVNRRMLRLGISFSHRCQILSTASLRLQVLL